MKKTKNIILTLSSIIGVSAAFAKTPDSFTGTTYYCITDDNGGYVWTKVKPGGGLYVCVAGECYCTIVTNNVSPIANQTPPDSKLISHTQVRSKWVRASPKR